MSNASIWFTVVGMSAAVRILNIPISTRSFDETFEWVLGRVAQKLGGYVCFVNVHTITDAQVDQALYEALRQSELAAPDGYPIKWVAPLFGGSIRSRVCGPDFSHRFWSDSKSTPITQGFIGGQLGQGKRLIKKYKLSGVSYCPPFRPFSAENAKEDWNHFLELCPNRTPPPIVWVGLGAPKQERWMREVSLLAPETLFFGIGAAFDFHLGDKVRAPIWMQRIGLEWLHRLLSEPNRLFFRYLKTNSRFLYYLLVRPRGFDENTL